MLQTRSAEQYHIQKASEEGCNAADTNNITFKKPVTMENELLQC